VSTQATTVADAVATRDTSPTALIATYSTDFARVLPSHIRAETWVRLAQGALRRGKRIADKSSPDCGMFELEIAARNNTGVFLAALLDAARLGLDPASEQYYLTPRKVKGRLEILGIVGYQGYIELMYRSGAVASVVAEVVHANDRYRYRRGIDTVPLHEFTPFSSDDERGPLIGVYAYARMIGDPAGPSPVSRVIELSAGDIAAIRAVNPGSSDEYSPWVRWPKSMWLKSAVRQLRKWVPTSPEYRREVLRAKAEVMKVSEERSLPAPPLDPEDDDGIVDGAVVEDWPPVKVPPTRPQES
jgi:recombination protein RecT